MAKTEYPCRHCSKIYFSRSGAWKHEKKCESSDKDFTVSQSTVDEEPLKVAMPTSPSDEAVDTSSSNWADFEMPDESDATDTIPEAIKLLSRPKPKNMKKMSAKEFESFKATEIALLKMGLGGIDVILTQYGKGVCLDKEFEVRHSDSSKNIVASAQHAWLQEKGLSVSKYASTGVVAASLTGWYVAAPLARIRRDAKKPMLRKIGGGIGGFFSRLPLIGRLFKRKSKNSENEVGQDTTIEIGDYE